MLISHFSPTFLLHTGLGLLLEIFWPADPVSRDWDSHREVAWVSHRGLADHIELWRWSRQEQDPDIPSHSPG